MENYFDKLASIPTATLAFGQEDEGVIDSKIRPMWPNMKMVGVAFTVSTDPGDNKAIHQAVDIAPENSVLLVANGGDNSTAIVGDIIIRNCIRRGFRGFVTDGSMRDLKDCRELGLPIFASGISIKGPTKTFTKGILGESVQLGGINISTGDYIVGDDDGLVCIKKNLVKKVLDKALDKESLEEEIIDRINKGENTIDIFKIRN